MSKRVSGRTSWVREHLFISGVFRGLYRPACATCCKSRNANWSPLARMALYSSMLPQEPPFHRSLAWVPAEPHILLKSLIYFYNVSEAMVFYRLYTGLYRLMGTLILLQPLREICSRP